MRLIIVALLMALVALSIDAMLPALLDFGRDLAAAQRNVAQLVVTALLLGLGFGQPLFGPLSDYVGRNPAFCAGFALFMAVCVLSILAPAIG